MVDRGDVQEMTPKPTLALIAAQAGSLQSSLLALMTTMPQIKAVILAEETPQVLRMIAEHRPALVVLDMGLLRGDAQTILEQIKTEWPLTRCVVLADDVQQQQKAQAAGADAVLIKGFLPAKLITTIEELLSEGKTDDVQVEKGEI